MIIMNGNKSRGVNLQHKILQILIVLLGNAAHIQHLVLLLQAQLKQRHQQTHVDVDVRNKFIMNKIECKRRQLTTSRALFN